MDREQQAKTGVQRGQRDEKEVRRTGGSGDIRRDGLREARGERRDGSKDVQRDGAHGRYAEGRGGYERRGERNGVPRSERGSGAYRNGGYERRNERQGERNGAPHGERESSAYRNGGYEKRDERNGVLRSGYERRNERQGERNGAPHGEYERHNERQGEQNSVPRDGGNGRRMAAEGVQRGGAGRRSEHDDGPRGFRRDAGNQPHGREGQPGGKPKYAPRPDDNARIVALNALSAVSQQGAYCQLALDQCLRASRISPEDKRLATRIFYSAVENKIRLNFVLKQFIDKYPDPYTADVLHIAAAQLLFMDKVPDHAVVDQAVRHMKLAHRERYGGLVNGVLRSLIRARDAGEIAYPDREKEPVRWLSVMYSLPEELLERLVAAFGMETAEQIAAWKPDERREVVRPNFMLMDEGAFEKYAQRMGWDYEKAVSPGALLLKGAGDLAGLPDYRKGLFSIQSVGSMLAALAVRPKRGMNVLDACAAPGGKTAYIAEQLDGTGRVYAWDVHEHRVNLIRAQAERLRLYNVRPAVRDARRHYEDMDWTVDAVLVDAPCSGLGEMANKPDIKYRITGESIDALVKTQAEILDSVCGYVKPGGALVYSTCTIMPEENVGQVRAFLERHPEFEMDLDVRWLPEAFRARVQDGCLQLMGHLDQTEGFFIARMRKKQSRRA